MQNIPKGLIPYSHELYLTGKYIAETRGGFRPDEVVYLKSLDFPVIYAFENCSHACTNNGQYLLKEECDRDLFLRPKTVKKWHPVFTSMLFKTKEDCERYGEESQKFLKAVEVEVNED
jgi:hypothetical protein